MGPYVHKKDNVSAPILLFLPCSNSLYDEFTSGKSTQNAFMFRPYRKLAKLSLKRARLSCISWKCIMLASRSAMASESSAKAGSNALSGNGASPETLFRADSRKEPRDDGRSGVVGRGVRDRDVDRARASPAMVIVDPEVVGSSFSWNTGQSKLEGELYNWGITEEYLEFVDFRSELEACWGRHVEV